MGLLIGRTLESRCARASKKIQKATADPARLIRFAKACGRGSRREHLHPHCWPGRTPTSFPRLGNCDSLEEPLAPETPGRSTMARMEMLSMIEIGRAILRMDGSTHEEMTVLSACAVGSRRCPAQVQNRNSLARVMATYSNRRSSPRSASGRGTMPSSHPPIIVARTVRPLDPIIVMMRTPWLSAVARSLPNEVICDRNPPKLRPSSIRASSACSSSMHAALGDPSHREVRIADCSGRPGQAFVHP